MNFLDYVLEKTPESDASWHCPWFKLIEFQAVNGTFFGALSYFLYGADLGLVAVGIGLSAGAFSFGGRARTGDSC